MSNNSPAKSLFAPLQMVLGFIFRPIGKLIGFILRPIGKGLAKVPMPYREYVMPAVAVFIALFGIPLLGSYWVKIFTQVAIFAVVAIGANILYGRVGLASLCQIGLMGIGTWCTLRIEYATHLPLPIVWIIGALITMVIGVIVGLPALRLSGLYLAMITLMAAGGITIVLNGLSFPNGGPGFKGLVTTVETRKTLTRPAGFSGDNAWYRLCVGVVVVALLMALWHLRNRPGRAWASIRQSEAAALAAGIDVTRYKLWAFALASFLTGLAGGVYASSVGSPSTTTFQTPDNVTLFAVVIIGAVVIGGKYSLWGAIFAALLTGFLPAFFKLILGNVMEDPDQIGIILFGFGVLLNLILATRAAKKKGLSL
jgi:branched-chain amino acid transport system permease protein